MKKIGYKRVAYIILCLSFLISGCGFYYSFRMQTDTKYKEFQRKSALAFWSKKSTPYLIKHFKVRVKENNNSYQGHRWPNLFSGRFERYAMDYEIILSILKERLDNKEVLECFLEILQNPYYVYKEKDNPEGYHLSARDVVEAATLYYDKGVDVTTYFIDLYKNPKVHFDVKHEIVEVLLARDIKVPELIPFIRDIIKEKQLNMFYSPSVYKEEMLYLKSMGIEDKELTDFSYIERRYRERWKEHMRKINKQLEEEKEKRNKKGEQE